MTSTPPSMGGFFCILTAAMIGSNDGRGYTEMIRIALESDIAAIATIYDELLTYEEQNGSCTNWKRRCPCDSHIVRFSTEDGTWVWTAYGETCAGSGCEIGLLGYSARYLCLQ